MVPQVSSIHYALVLAVVLNAREGFRRACVRGADDGTSTDRQALLLCAASVPFGALVRLPPPPTPRMWALAAALRSTAASTWRSHPAAHSQCLHSLLTLSLSLALLQLGAGALAVATHARSDTITPEVYMHGMWLFGACMSCAQLLQLPRVTRRAPSPAAT